MGKSLTLLTYKMAFKNICNMAGMPIWSEEAFQENE